MSTTENPTENPTEKTYKTGDRVADALNRKGSNNGGTVVAVKSDTQIRVRWDRMRHRVSTVHVANVTPGV